MTGVGEIYGIRTLVVITLFGEKRKWIYVNALLSTFYLCKKKLLLCLFRWRLAIGMAKIKDIPHGFIFSLQQCFDLGEEKLIFTT